MTEFVEDRWKRFVVGTGISTILMYFLQVLFLCLNGFTWIGGSVDILMLVSNVLLLGQSYGEGINAPLWYVHVLMICYILAYCIRQLEKRIGKIMWIFPIILGIYIIQYVGDVNIIVNIRIARGMVSFFCGIVAGAFVERFKNREMLLKYVMFLCVLSFWGGYVCLNNKGIYITNLMVYFPVLIWTPLVVFFYCCKNINSMFDNKFFKWCGQTTWPIYLTNFPALVLCTLLNEALGLKLDYASIKYFGMYFGVNMLLAVTLSIVEKKLRLEYKRKTRYIE